MVQAQYEDDIYIAPDVRLKSYSIKRSAGRQRSGREKYCFANVPRERVRKRTLRSIEAKNDRIEYLESR